MKTKIIQSELFATIKRRDKRIESLREKIDEQHRFIQLMIMDERAIKMKLIAKDQEIDTLKKVCAQWERIEKKGAKP